jgi:hypothetical protein
MAEMGIHLSAKAPLPCVKLSVHFVKLSPQMWTQSVNLLKEGIWNYKITAMYQASSSYRYGLMKTAENAVRNRPVKYDK